MKKVWVIVVDERIITEAPSESAEGIVAWEPKRAKDGAFRAAFCEFRFSHEGKRLLVPKGAAEAVHIEDDDKVWALALTRHLRM